MPGIADAVFEIPYRRPENLLQAKTKASTDTVKVRSCLKKEVSGLIGSHAV